MTLNCVKLRPTKISYYAIKRSVFVDKHDNNLSLDEKGIFMYCNVAFGLNIDSCLRPTEIDCCRDLVKQP